MYMKKLTILPIIFILSACQPSELDRCIEANIPDVIVPDNQEIISDVMDAYEIVLPDTAKQQYFLLTKYENMLDVFWILGSL